MRLRQRWRAACAPLFGAAVVLTIIMCGEGKKKPKKEVPEGEKEPVWVLTAENFTEVVKKHASVLVGFYEPWCRHCHILKEDFEPAAEELRNVDRLQTVFAAINTEPDAEAEIGKQADIKHYPSFRYYVNGEMTYYTNEPSTSGFKDWVRRRELPPVKEMSEEGVMHLLNETKDGEFAVVARLKRRSAKAKMYRAIASELVVSPAARFTFALVWLPDGADGKTDMSLTMWRPGFDGAEDPREATYPGAWTADAMTSWLRRETYAMVGTAFTIEQYGHDTVKELGWQGSVVVLLNETQANAEELRAKAFENTLQLARAEPDWRFAVVERKTLLSAELEALAARMRPKDLPTVTALYGKRRYIMEGGGEIARPDGIKDFLDRVQARKVRPVLKSEAMPKPAVDEKGVTIIVGRNFEKIVLDPTKDVVVDFFAVWCDHCSKLLPIWDELSKAGQQLGWAEKNVVVAKMDADNNEADQDLELTGYPAIVLFPAVPVEKKFRQRLRYKGPYELERLTDFVVENARNLEGYDPEDEESMATKKKKRGARHAEL